MPVAPDFFLVGAPKCATGSIDGMLTARPGVFLARKDLHFFAPDLATTQVPLTSSDYDALFEDAPAGALLGESSVGYLRSEQAPEAIHARNREAAIVLSLRNPLDAIPSLHQHCLFYGIEELEDLAEALAAEPGRAAGRGLPRRCAHPWMLAYTAVYRYAAQLRRYFDVFGRERCHVMLYDDFRADPDASIAALAAFLGLSPDAVPVPDLRLNHAREAHSRRLSSWLTDPPPVARALVRASLPQSVRRGVADAVLTANTRAQATRRPVDPAVRAALAEAFAEDVAQVSALLDRDLSDWLTRR